ncbi:hypothetical protein TWF694_011356 [Orbilia ellipsospora]|uniref:Glucose-methanol-choline oxidoreductase C-terminal domain-containing protein n=1 Tax=Orbilia ellipsospora TaxID=2528407 RepID=A0AAV9X506_9PEZI
MYNFIATSIEEVALLVEQGYYDFIIVGTGMGGGVLARTLAEKARQRRKECRILLIERGGLMFTTHCANTAGPGWYKAAGPSTSSDHTYTAVKSPVSTVSANSYPYAGGPVYCIGGRSNVWGMYTPKIDDDTLQKYFPKDITDYLKSGGYDTAYALLCNDGGASLDSPYPMQEITKHSVVNIKRILVSLNYMASRNSDNANAKGDSVSSSAERDQDQKATGEKQKVHREGSQEKSNLYTCDGFSCSPFGAQFAPRQPDKALYQIPMGGFSTVSWILNKAFNKSETVNLLTDTQVLTVNTECTQKGRRKIISITVLHRPTNKKINILTGGTTVILSAGTIDTAKIALQSGLDRINKNTGRGLTDHDIWATRIECQLGPDVKSLGDQALRVHGYATLTPKSGLEAKPCLVNITINATSFLGSNEDHQFPTLRLESKSESSTRLHKHEGNGDGRVVLQTVFQLGSELQNHNRVLSLPELTPTIELPSKVDNSAYIDSMKAMTVAIAKNLAKGAKEFEEMNPRLGCAEFGFVSHEVGTMRMGEDNDHSRVVDTNLKVCGLDNLYVCDLSVFPFSAAANPSLTLTALAQRLGHHLIDRKL